MKSEVFTKSTSDRFIVDVIVPGYMPNDIKVKLIPGASGTDPYVMEISAKKTTAEQKLGAYKRVEGFKERINIDAKYQSKEAYTEYEAGILRVSVPIKESRKKISIHPKVEGSEETPDVESEE